MQRIRTDQERTMPQTRCEVKFAGLLRMIAAAKAKGADTMMIHHPETLGDTYYYFVSFSQHGGQERRHAKRVF
jgi:hypothetical protein